MANWEDDEAAIWSRAIRFSVLLTVILSLTVGFMAGRAWERTINAEQKGGTE